MEKPKLTREQACEIWGLTNGTCDGFLNALEQSGYMEKQETTLERAERLYNNFQQLHTEWSWEPETECLVDIIKVYREAIREMKDALDAAYPHSTKGGKQ